MQLLVVLTMSQGVYMIVHQDSFHCSKQSHQHFTCQMCSAQQCKSNDREIQQYILKLGDNPTGQCAQTGQVQVVSEPQYGVKYQKIEEKIYDNLPNCKNQLLQINEPHAEIFKNQISSMLNQINQSQVVPEHQWGIICQKIEQKIQDNFSHQKKKQIQIDKLYSDQQENQILIQESVLSQNNQSSSNSESQPEQQEQSCSDYDGKEDQKNLKKRNRKCKKNNSKKKIINKNCYDHNIKCLKELLGRYKQKGNKLDQKVFKRNQKGKNELYSLVLNNNLQKVIAQIFYQRKMMRQIQLRNALKQNKLFDMLQLRKLIKHFVRNLTSQCPQIRKISKY